MSLNQPIESLEDLQRRRRNLIITRDIYKSVVLSKIEKFSHPIGVISMIFKPLSRCISWTPIFISVAKIALSFFRNRK